MTDELTLLISCKNSGNLSEKDNSLVPESLVTKDASLWSYFDSKMAEKNSTVTPESALRPIITENLYESHLERSNNSLTKWNAHK